MLQKFTDAVKAKTNSMVYTAVSYYCTLCLADTAACPADGCCCSGTSEPEFKISSMPHPADSTRRMLCCLLCAVQMTVDAVKAKVNSMTGTSVLSMTLHLQDESGRLVDVLQEGGRKLGYYSPRDG
jgi:hypothetical protein